MLLFVLLSDLLLRGCKSKPGLELTLCIAEVDLKASVFLTTNVDNKNMYWV